MKVVVLLSIVVPAVAPLGAASAQPAPGCAQVVQNINDLSVAISGGASSYWSHRKNFVELKFGPSSAAVQDQRGDQLAAMQLAEQERTQAISLKAAMRNTLASFKALAATARSQNCLSPAQLSAIVEPAIKAAKGINIDQFAETPAEEASTGQTPPRMPRN